MNTRNCKKSNPIMGYARHSHNCYEVVATLSGTVYTQIGEKQYQIEAGDVIVIPPGVPHAGHADAAFTDIYFAAEKLDFSDVVVVKDHDGSIRALMDILYLIMIGKDPERAVLADNLAECAAQAIKISNQEHSLYGFLPKLRDRIREKVFDPAFRVADAVEETGYHPDYVRRCFKKEYGVTPTAFLTDLRLDAAAKLLLHETFQGIADVALQCGFEDSFYFSSVFRKHFGQSPREYRKRNY